jgi:PAS domain S-box-containing protein
MSAKILVVDDSATDQKIIASILSDYNVLLAGDGQEALRIIDENPDLDLIILDLYMPNMDGFEVLHILRTTDHYRHLRTIILTNDDELENEIRGLQLGAVDYIRKPLHLHSLRVRTDIHLKLIRIQRLYETKLHDQGITFETIFQQAPIGIVITHSSEVFSSADRCNLVSINPVFEQICGRTKDEIITLGWEAITHPDDVEKSMEYYKKLEAGEINSYWIQKRYVKPDGSITWVNMLVASLPVSNHHRDTRICLAHDITEQKLLEQSLSESERSKSVLLSSLPGMAYRCNYDREWTMQFVSEGCYKLTDYSPESLLYNRDLSYNDLITPEYRELLWNEWERIIKDNLPFKYEYEITTASGEQKWVLEMGQAVYNDAGEVEALEGLVLDISERKAMENHLRYINEHDRWTGLYNRESLERALKQDARSKNPPKRALIGINLSPFFTITVNYGFNYTMNLIKKAVEALRKFSREDRMLYNSYESRFVFYVKNYKDRSELIEFSEEIAATLVKLFVTDRLGGGMGILEIDQYQHLGIDVLLKKLLIASERSVNIFDHDFKASFYDEELEALIVREGDIRQELSRIAVEKTSGEYFLRYQPILDLKTDRICGFEALARLQTEKLGLVSPLEFIPIAEETKLIIPLGEKAFVDAFRFVKKLIGLGYHSMTVSVNVSAIQLLAPDFTNTLFSLMKKMGVNPANIGIEITESVFSSDYNLLNKVIGELKDAGLHVAIDDFGTGYSSLARVKELNVNSIKIDKHFIDKLLETGPDRAITGDIISMSHRLGHCTIAEGVEYEAQKEYLLANGCDKIQGYLVGRPLDEEAAIELLRKYSCAEDDYQLLDA